ncbi:uncharacterized protein LOC144102031 isoform X2 [Amblyomma americanum]
MNCPAIWIPSVLIALYTVRYSITVSAASDQTLEANATSEGDCRVATILDVVGIKEGDVVEIQPLLKCIMVGLFGKIYRPFALKWLRFMVADFAWDKDREVYIGATSLAQLGLSSFPDELFLAKHTTCGGYFQVTLPKSTEKCINETLKLCEAGQEVDKLFLEKFLFPVKCAGIELLRGTSQQEVRSVSCDLMNSVRGLFNAKGRQIYKKRVDPVCNELLATA